jgi:hypothetical protein
MYQSLIHKKYLVYSKNNYITYKISVHLNKCVIKNVGCRTLEWDFK